MSNPKMTTVAKFEVNGQNIEVSVSYNRNEPEDYTITYALHNGVNVTDFYKLLDDSTDGIFYPQIVEAIARDIYSELAEKYLPSWNGVSHLNNPTTNNNDVQPHSINA